MLGFSSFGAAWARLGSNQRPLACEASGRYPADSAFRLSASGFAPRPRHWSNPVEQGAYRYLLDTELDNGTRSDGPFDPPVGTEGDAPFEDASDFDDARGQDGIDPGTGDTARAADTSGVRTTTSSSRHRMLTAAVAILAALSGAVSAPGAQAARMKSFVNAEQIASTYFTPRCGTPILRWVTTLDDPSYSAESFPATCEIRFLTSTWRWNPVFICTFMVHEYGHLAGLEHSTSPRSIMYPQPQRVPARCWALASRSRG